MDVAHAPFLAGKLRLSVLPLETMVARDLEVRGPAIEERHGHLAACSIQHDRGNPAVPAARLDRELVGSDHANDLVRARNCKLRTDPDTVAVELPVPERHYRAPGRLV